MSVRKGRFLNLLKLFWPSSYHLKGTIRLIWSFQILLRFLQFIFVFCITYLLSNSYWNNYNNNPHQNQTKCQLSWSLTRQGATGLLFQLSSPRTTVPTCCCGFLNPFQLLGHPGIHHRGLRICTGLIAKGHHPYQFIILSSSHAIAFTRCNKRAS